MLTTKQTSSARVPNFRLVFATLTLALVVLTCVGIQSIANRVAAPQPQATVSVQALADTPAAAPVQGGGGFPLGLVAVVLLVGVGVRLVSRVRSSGTRGLYWDEMPW
jgi:hypothetical protein